MPSIVIQSIESFSSEDTNYPALNLLSKDARKWKCRDPGEKTVYVVLRLEKPLVINGIDIGNDHSAFIEVLVAKSGPTNPEFKEILLTSSFMTPIESRNSTNVNRVRCFTQNALVEPVSRGKWDLVKIICTQPFNSRVQYGVTFIKLHTSFTEKKDKSLVPEKFQQQIVSEANSESDKNHVQKRTEVQKPELPKVVKLGRFILREDSPDSDGGSTSTTTLFTRWKESRGDLGTPKVNKEVSRGATISTAAAIRNASTPLAIKENQSKSLVKKNVITPRAKPQLFDDDSEDEDMKPLNRNRDALLYDKEDEKSDDKMEKKLAEDRARQQREKASKENFLKRDRSLSEKKEKLHDTSSSKFKDFLSEKPSTSSGKQDTKIIESEKIATSSAPTKPRNDPNIFSKGSDDKTPRESNDIKRRDERKKRPSESPKDKFRHDEESKKKKLKLQTNTDEEANNVHKRLFPTYKPFNKLLENVVLVISGIQNPDRASLRSQALSMGAKYKSDWDSSCTHLICAFKNTPKYNQVHGQGKIVKKEWIERCHSLRKRISWRKFALDSVDAEQSDSEGEIIDISNKASGDSQKTKASEDKAPAETDEEALAHYDLDDVVMVEQQAVDTFEISGSDTEEEIERVKKKQSFKNENIDKLYDKSTEDEGPNSPADVSTELNFFKGKIFYLDPEVGAVDVIKLERYVKMYRGTITENVSEAHYLVTRNKKSMAASFTGELIKPLWIYECHDMECLIPSERYRL
ncbi:DNA repair protein XRCC1 [Malaya genurostris]|uniref:DNA repair protein XRCC1 n=1 Tax=Malaya genurostris TaxID=325434 RepID=UPI0026F3D995|nr:DNA repair protein XRCC1 [Malaya genurostris]